MTRPILLGDPIEWYNIDGKLYYKDDGPEHGPFDTIDDLIIYYNTRYTRDIYKDAPAPNSLWDHDNGHTYWVSHISNPGSKRGPKFEPTVCYYDVSDGHPYSRRLADWPGGMAPSQLELPPFLLGPKGFCWHDFSDAGASGFLCCSNCGILVEWDEEKRRYYHCGYDTDQVYAEYPEKKDDSKQP